MGWRSIRFALTNMTPALAYKIDVIIIVTVALRITSQAEMPGYGGSVHNGSGLEKYLNIADALHTYGELSHMEPALIIFFAIGSYTIIDWIRQRTMQTQFTAI